MLNFKRLSAAGACRRKVFGIGARRNRLCNDTTPAYVIFAAAL